jgi:hypothetical protein
MPTLKYAAIIVSGFSLLAALLAAFYWLRSCRIYIDVSRVPPKDRQAAYIIALQIALSQAAWLNSQAAIWTGIAAVLSATTTVIGIL